MRIRTNPALALLLASLALLTACRTGADTTQPEQSTTATATAVASEPATAGPETPTPSPTPTNTGSPAGCEPPYPTAVPRAYCVDPARFDAAAIGDVIDGDTIDVFVGGTPERVRVFGIDAPERGDRCAREATARVTDLVARGVRLRADVRNRDSYRRLLRYVYTPEGLSVDAVLIAEGLAFAWTRDGALRDDLVAIEAEARATGRGCLWEIE